jgi:hypothetical protein
LTVWRRFRALRPGDRRLVIEAAVLLAVVRIGLSLIPFQTLRRVLDYYAGSRGGAVGSSNEPTARVAWAVTSVARRWPRATTCLIEALAADAMLRRRACASEIRFGVRPPSGPASRLDAHAWVEQNGVVVLGEVVRMGDYAVMSIPGPS